eukprot:9303775-Alexandrium_andersonii.AAC.1
MKAGLDGDPRPRNRQLESSNPQSANPQPAKSLAIGAREARNSRTFKIASSARDLNCVGPKTTSNSTQTTLVRGFG